MLKKIAALIICTAIFITPASIFVKAEPVSDLDGYLKAYENDKLALYYKSDRAFIAVRDKKSQKLWYSSLPESQYPKENITKLIKDEFSSLLVLNYTLLNKLSSSQTTAPLESLEYKSTVKKLDRGIEYSISINEINLIFSIQITLDENGLEVTVPSDRISEGAGISEQIDIKKQSIEQFIDDTLKSSAEMKKDKRIPSDIKGSLDTAVSELKKMKAKLNTVKNAIGIEAVSDNLLKQLNEIQNYYTGSSEKPGFFSKVQLSKKIKDDIKAEYLSRQNDFDDSVMPCKITISSLKAINAGSITELQLLPYLGACGDNVKGYMIYPNGCGALTEFKTKHGSYSSNYKASAFSEQTPDIDWEKSMDGVGLQRTFVSYFGVKQEDSAFVAYVENGQSESNINFSPSGYIVNVNRISSSFVYRRTIAIQNSGGTWLAGQQPVAFETERGKFNARVRYFFLDGDDADYSGMARTLSNYLNSKGILKKSKIAMDKAPLALDIFGGYNQKVLIFNNYIKGTTFEQAEKIINDITKSKKIPLFVNYIGYARNGYGKYPSDTSTSPDLGGDAALKKLSQTIKAKGGYIFLQDNHVEAQYSGGNYVQGDLALGTNLRTIQTADKKTYLLSPKKVFERVTEKYLPYVKNLGVYGITEDRLGSFIYYDYSSKTKSDRENTTKLWQEILKKEKEELSGAAVTGGNEYTFPYADWIMNVSTSTSGYIYTDKGIPFYQMLIHGYIPYTSEPVNQYYDKQLQFLKMIEYGNMPLYRLTYNAVDTNEAGIYVSQYSAFQDDIIDTYNKYSSDFTDICSQQIIKHSINGDIAVVTYANGVRVYINYGSKDTTTDGVTIKSMDYYITKPSGGEMLEKNETKSVQEGEQSGIHIHNSLGGWILPVLLISAVLFAGIGVFIYQKRSNLRA